MKRIKNTHSDIEIRIHRYRFFHNGISKQLRSPLPRHCTLLPHYIPFPLFPVFSYLHSRGTHTVCALANPLSALRKGFMDFFACAPTGGPGFIVMSLSRLRSKEAGLWTLPVQCRVRRKFRVPERNWVASLISSAGIFWTGGNLGGSGRSFVSRLFITMVRIVWYLRKIKSKQ